MVNHIEIARLDDDLTSLPPSRPASVSGDDDAGAIVSTTPYGGAGAAGGVVDVELEKPGSVTGSESDDDSDLKKEDSSGSLTAPGDKKVITDADEKNPWGKDFCGIPINYFSVGVIYGGSVSVLYPLLVVQHGVTSSFSAAASSLVTLFWSYKILFGILCDCFPIRGQKWKPYIVLGWIVCAAMLVVVRVGDFLERNGADEPLTYTSHTLFLFLIPQLASMGENVSPVNLVLMLTFANLGYVAADVAADGMMVWMAHHETVKRRGKIQSLIYIMRNFGRIFINLVIMFAFSGPKVSCPGYETDPSIPCTTDEAIMARNPLSETSPETWCYEQCPKAKFAFGMTIPQFAWLIAAVNLASIPSYFVLKEEKKIKESMTKVFSDFWVVVQRKAVWKVMLYTMISSITFDVYIASKSNANFVWLELSTVQNQILNIVRGASIVQKLHLVVLVLLTTKLLLFCY
jgi:BT1 family